MQLMMKLFGNTTRAKASTIAKTKIAEAKALEEKQAQLDKKPGRFFEDQPECK